MPVNTGAARAIARKQYERTQLTQTVTLLKPERSQDAVGAGKSIYKDSGTLKAKIMRRSEGQKTEAGQQVKAVDTWEIRLPFGTEIKPIYQFRHGATTYAVQTLDDGRADALFLSVFCVRAK